MENFKMEDVLIEMKAMGFDTYKNEYETMKLFRDARIQMSTKFMWNSRKIDKPTTFCTSESNQLREIGNALFKDSPENNALEASRFYTKAILSAPAGTEALALAHANRAMSLQKFGYFQQAYDDCECSLEQGYPKNLRLKIIARQATCAEKLGDATLLEKHLKSLMALSLNKTYEAQVEELQQSLEKLKLKEMNLKKNEQNDKEYRGAQVITKSASKERCLIAENLIKKDELIFTERAFSFVPSTERHVCQSCGATQLIPFPCYNCFGRVVYCSLKCRVAHQATHAYECLGYQKGLFDESDHLALRVVLDGLPEIMSFLCQKKTSKDIWKELTSEKSSLMQSKLQYTQILSMTTHLEKKSLFDIFDLANYANVFTWYLRNQTKFFNLFKKTKVSLEDWQFVIASLILRHMGQLEANANSIGVMAIQIADPFESTLLVNKLWQSPYHVRRGYLHMFCKCEEIICASFPYFSNCNNACYRSIVTKRNGRYLSAYAVEDIEAGDEILYPYTRGYLNFKRIHRQMELMEKFHYECNCEKCTMDNPDEEYEKYHQFRCEKCQEIFIDEIGSELRCTSCFTMQDDFVKSVAYIEKLLSSPSMDKTIRQVLTLLNKLISSYEVLDQWLVGPHDIKVKLSIKLLEKCFEMGDMVFSHEFSFYDMSKIIEILKFHLQYELELYHLKTEYFTGPMTFLWDLIALGKYQCTASEMEEMLPAIEILSDETKKLFINYYNDYIVGNLKKVKKFTS